MNPPESRPAFSARHPWLFVVFAFLLLIGAWSTLIMVAMKNSPQVIETSAK